MSKRQELINEIATEAKSNPDITFDTSMLKAVGRKTQSLDFIAEYISENIHVLNEEIQGVDWVDPEVIADYFIDIVIEDTYDEAKKLADSGVVPSISEETSETPEKTNVRAELADKIVDEIAKQYNDGEITEIDDSEVREIAQEIINDTSYDSLRFVADYVVEKPEILNEKADEESPSLSSLYVAHFEIVMSADITDDVMKHEKLIALQEGKDVTQNVDSEQVTKEEEKLPYYQMVDGYAEKVIEDIFEAVNEKDSEITNAEEICTTGDVIQAVSKDDDIWIFKKANISKPICIRRC